MTIDGGGEDFGWVVAFADRHRARFKPHDWPADDSDEFVDLVGDWADALRGAGVSEDEANRASRRLVLHPPTWRREHLPAVLATVAEMRRERAPAADPAASTREAAQLASRGCEYCSGGGLVSVFHPAPDPARKVPASVAAHCVCSHGRWVRRATAQKDEPLLRRVPDFADVLAGRSAWLAEDPAYRGMPA